MICGCMKTGTTHGRFQNKPFSRRHHVIYSSIMQTKGGGDTPSACAGMRIPQERGDGSRCDPTSPVLLSVPPTTLAQEENSPMDSELSSQCAVVECAACI